MSFTTIFIIAGVVLLIIFFLIAKLAIRWAIRVAIVGVILVALLGAGGFWWWSNRLIATPAKPKPRPSATPARRSSAP
jgi:predicted benzoate:H+ symporter BenE